MATQSNFYHRDTEKKLKAISNYLEGFLKVMKNQDFFETIYIDAFAGSGELPTDYEAPLFDGIADFEEIILGSAIRAVQLSRKFSQYIFIDDNAAKAAELEERLKPYRKPGDNIRIVVGDANSEIAKLIPKLSQPNVRAVVFLDPFGNQVGWHTLEALARTRHVDLWYLFPAMLGVYRQVRNSDAKMTPEQVSSLDRLFGPNNWKEAFIETKHEQDLFGDVVKEQKIADVQDITRFKIKCMKKIFKGGVSDYWLPLGRKRAHWYSLLFAMANPSLPAVSAGHAIAKAILTHR